MKLTIDIPDISRWVNTLNDAWVCCDKLMDESEDPYWIDKASTAKDELELIIEVLNKIHQEGTKL
jgi:hypothetical protein